MATKRSFIIHVDSLSVLKKLKDEQAGKLFKAIALFQEDGLLPEDDFISIVFEPFLNQFLRDSEKYQNIVERNKLNGSKGGRPKNPMGYLETQSNPKEPKKADSGIDSGSESKISNANEECKSELKSQFESFWNLYDKKKSRPDAEKKFKAALKKDTFENIITGLEKYIKARGSDSQYWKHPSTWLHNECWKDDYTQAKSTDSSFNSTQWSKY